MDSGEDTYGDERRTMRTSSTQAEVTALRCALPELSHILADAPETSLGQVQRKSDASKVDETVCIMGARKQSKQSENLE